MPGTLDGYVDNFPSPCWARVICGDGDYVFISVTPHGTAVKKSKRGILGKKLFSADAERSLKTSVALNASCGADATIPADIRSPQLRGFVAAALCSETVGIFEIKIASGSLNSLLT